MKQTQKNKILELLKSQEWVSTVDAVQHYILRASERIRELEAEGYVIEHSIVKGKHYAKYRLVSEPKKEVELDNNGGISAVSIFGDSSLQEITKHIGVETDLGVSQEKGERNMFHLQTSLSL